MKVQLFGKEMEIKKELIIFIVPGLVLLGALLGSLMLSSRGDIIIEDGQTRMQQPSANSGAGGVRPVSGPGGVSAAGGHVGEGMGGFSGAATGDISGNSVDAGGFSGAPADAAGGTGLAAGSAGPGGGEAGGAAAGPVGGPAGSKDEIKVYVVGCVKRPGIVTLTKGQMICDAVREAGGLTEDADAENINMVYTLNENVMLVIKSKNERNAAGEGAVVHSGSGPDAEVIGGGDDAHDGRNDIRLVNINTAGIDELDTLPGIGEAKARDIIAYREKHGRFNRIEDIMKVPGIKQNRFESIKDYITVD